jgi:hypothetical protein
MEKVETINIKIYELNLPISLCIITYPNEKNGYSLQGVKIRRL